MGVTEDMALKRSKLGYELAITEEENGVIDAFVFFGVFVCLTLVILGRDC